MSEKSGSHMNLVAAVIGAVGAIGAALIPVYLSSRSAPPAPVAPTAADDKSAGVPPVVADKAAPPAAADGKAVASRDKAGEPKPAPKTETGKGSTKTAANDLARIQGVWRIVFRHTPKQEIDKEKLAAEKPTWTFQDQNLETSALVDGKPRLLKGKFTLHTDTEPKQFDFTGRPGPAGKRAEWRGIYEFDGEVLTICFRIKLVGSPDDPLPERPAAFLHQTGEPGKTLMRLRQVEE